MQRIAYIAMWLALAVVTASAAPSVEFDIQPRTLRLGEAATCQIVVRGVDNPPSPRIPQIDGLQISGPSVSQSTYSSISNGRRTTDSSIVYQFRIMPLRGGDFTIGPFNYALGSQVAQLPQVNLRVVDPQRPADGQQSSANDRPALYAVLSVPQTNVFNQQVFDLHLSVYSRGLNLGREIGIHNLPSVGVEFLPYEELGSSREVVDGDVYEVRTFRLRAHALTAGDIRLQPTIRVNVITQRQRRERRSLFDDMFGSTQAQPVSMTTEPVDLTIHPLPQDKRPQHYTGAVGQFVFEVQAKPTELNVGDPITITMRVAGQGNIDSVTAPQIVYLDDFKVYEPRLITKNVNASAAVGEKIFEQVVLPTTDEITELPPVSFTYFDPQSTEYKTIHQGPFPLTIHASSNASMQLVQSLPASSLPQTRVLGADIIYLKPLPSTWIDTGRRPWFRRKGPMAVQLIPILALGALVLGLRRRRELETNVAKARRQKAPRSARKGLAQAESAAARGDRTAFFEAVAQTMADYFGNRLNLEPGQVSYDRVAALMAPAGLGARVLESVRLLFERCEQERFAGGAASAEPGYNQVLADLREILKACERVRL